MARDPEKVRRYARETRVRRIARIGADGEARRQKNSHLKHKYGITLTQYEEMWQIQCGRCAICTVDLTVYTFAHLDHNHDTNQVRALLCPNCNLGISWLEDREWCEQATKYLRHYENI